MTESLPKMTVEESREISRLHRNAYVEFFLDAETALELLDNPREPNEFLLEILELDSEKKD